MRLIPAIDCCDCDRRHRRQLVSQLWSARARPRQDEALPDRFEFAPVEVVKRLGELHQDTRGDRDTDRHKSCDHERWRKYARAKSDGADQSHGMAPPYYSIQCPLAPLTFHVPPVFVSSCVDPS